MHGGCIRGQAAILQQQGRATVILVLIGAGAMFIIPVLATPVALVPVVPIAPIVSVVSIALAAVPFMTVRESTLPVRLPAAQLRSSHLCSGHLAVWDWLGGRGGHGLR